MNDLKMVLTPSLYVFVAEIESLIEQGYSVDYENNPPSTFGICYEVGMVKKNDAGAEIFADTSQQYKDQTGLPVIPQPHPKDAPPEIRNKGGRPRKA